MLAIFILNIKPNDNCITLKLSSTGDDIPKLLPDDNHHSQLTFPAISPRSPPITIPDNKNTNKIQKFLSLASIFYSSYVFDFL